MITTVVHNRGNEEGGINSRRKITKQNRMLRIDKDYTFYLIVAFLFFSRRTRTITLKLCR